MASPVNIFLLRFLYLAIACGTPLYSGTVLATEFVDLLRMSANHPAILSAENSAGAAMSDIDQAKALNSVKISAGVSATSYSGKPGYENSAFSPRVGASKVIYDHGRADAVVEGREAAYSMQVALTASTQENVEKQILSYYTTALSDTKINTVLDEQIEALATLRNRVKAIADIDPGRASEVNQVDARLNSARASREAREISLQQAWKQITQLLQKDVTLTHELPDLKKQGVLPATLEEAEVLLGENPRLIATRYKRDEASASVKQASKWNRPKWTVQLNVDSPRQHGEMQLLKGVALQFSSDLDLFDGGSGAAVAAGEASRLNAAELEIDATMRELLQQLRQLWVSQPLREQQIQILAAQVQVAKQTLDAGEEQFLAGRRPLTDLISFVSDYYSSLANYEDQRVQYVSTQWQIMSVLGRLNKISNKFPSLPAALITDKHKINAGSLDINSLKIQPNNKIAFTATMNDEKEKAQKRISKPANPTQQENISATGTNKNITNDDRVTLPETSTGKIATTTVKEKKTDIAPAVEETNRVNKTPCGVPGPAQMEGEQYFQNSMGSRAASLTHGYMAHSNSRYPGDSDRCWQ